MIIEGILTDGRGGEIKVGPLFSHVYIDDDIDGLNRRYEVWQLDGAQRLGSLDKAKKETLVARFLVLVRVDGRLAGVSKNELTRVAQRHNEHWYINQLIQEGYFREKTVKGVIVVFPTEKLLINQGVSLRANRRGPTDEI